MNGIYKNILWVTVSELAGGVKQLKFPNVLIVQLLSDHIYGNCANHDITTIFAGHELYYYVK